MRPAPIARVMHRAGVSLASLTRVSTVARQTPPRRFLTSSSSSSSNSTGSNIAQASRYWTGLDLLGSSKNNASLRSAALASTDRLGSRSGSLLFLRPYHVTARSLDQQQRYPGGNDVNKQEINQLDEHNHDHHKHDDDGIQHQHTNPIPPNTDPKARMLIGFTCTVCNNRSHKTMSKHAYEHGVVIMQCDHCKNRHLIADHLGWFKNGGVTIEDLMKENGETVQKLTKSYQLVKDGEVNRGTGTDHAASTATPRSEASSGLGAGSEEEGKKKPKTELELALEKAAEGMLEWIPKEVLQQEEERMRKSHELLDQSKKND